MKKWLVFSESKLKKANGHKILNIWISKYLSEYVKIRDNIPTDENDLTIPSKENKSKVVVSEYRIIFKCFINSEKLIFIPKSSWHKEFILWLTKETI